MTPLAESPNIELRKVRAVQHCGQCAFICTLIIDQSFSAVAKKQWEDLLLHMQGSTRLLVTHQRHFLPQCDRILVLKHGHQKALGTYSEIAATAHAELAQLENETEFDDAVYDNQLPTTAKSVSDHPVQELGLAPQEHGSAPQMPGSALQAANAGPVYARLNAIAPAAAAAASRVTDTANQLSTGQQMDSSLGVFDAADSLGPPTTAATAAVAVAPHAIATSQTHAINNVQPISDVGTVGQADLPKQAPGQGSKQQAAFSPAVVQKKKIALPPEVDLRWGPVKACSRWYDSLRGLNKAHKTKDESAADLEDEGVAKHQAQLNQQEGRTTGKVFAMITPVATLQTQYFCCCKGNKVWPQ